METKVGFAVALVAIACSLTAQEVSKRRDVDFDLLKVTERSVEVEKGETPSLLPAGDWKLVWHDEFSGTKFDASKWIYRTNFYGRVMKGYTDRGAELDGKGHLRLKLVLEDGELKATQLQTGSNYHDAPRNLEPNPWGQAPIWGVGEQPKPTFMHRYGYWEIRCRFQKLPGWWNAFWIQSPSIGMAPNARYAGVEVDVMENFHRDGRTTSGSIYGGYGKGYCNGGDRIDYKLDPNEWHRFGLLWTPTNYVYYCDGRETARTDKMVSQVEEFLIVSCEVKGWREGKMDKSGDEIRKAAIRPDGTLVDDAFEVDYVRVFDPTVSEKGHGESVSRADLVKAAKTMDLSGCLPSGIAVGNQTVGPADFLFAALETLETGAERVTIRPREQLGDFDVWPQLKTIAYAHSWMHAPDFDDTWPRNRIRWQLWTLRLE